MRPLERYSEPYRATGGLAAIGVLNQLGRPNMEPLEVLIREAVQNCWDARRPTNQGIRVEIGRRRLDFAAVDAVRSGILVDPPPGLPLLDELRPGLETLYFADFGTRGLGGPTRADAGGVDRDFVDFVRNIGQPPDNDLGGGSFGYGKAAFYIASRARTIVIDTLCGLPGGGQERRLLGCALGDNFDDDEGRPHTGRHWWGRIVDGVPEPLTGAEAEEAAEVLQLPRREGLSAQGTTVVVIAPGIAPESDDEEEDVTMEFIADALAWNFWPRMISTPGGARRTMDFTLLDDGRRIRIPDPRTHERLRDFVMAMDRLREEPGGDDDDFVIDRPIGCLRPIHALGRLVIQRGPIAPVTPPQRPVPQGARVTANAVHHIALMRNAELVVKYLPGVSSVNGRMGYAGVFQCGVDVDEAFRRSEPPTHDDWNLLFVPTDAGYDKRFVKVALDRIARVCREAAGYDGVVHGAADGDGVPLGEFADALATLMPGFEGPGARRAATRGETRPTRKRRSAPGRSVMDDVAGEIWVEGSIGPTGAPNAGAAGAIDDVSGGMPMRAGGTDAITPRAPRAPQTRSGDDPSPALATDGSPVIRYPFELRCFGSRVRLRASVEVMTNDGGQVEAEAPLGYSPPAPHAWIAPDGSEHMTPVVVIGPEAADGRWAVEIPLTDETMMRVDITPELA